MSGLHRVVILATAPQSPFELACAVEVFGLERPGTASPYDVRICAERPGRLASYGGLGLQVEHGLEALADADTVVVAGWPAMESPPSQPLRDALVAAHDRGARMAALCFGAFLLAHAGLLDGRRATTHWREADRLAARFPEVEVDADVLFVVDGTVATSAGTGAALDLCLELARRDQGSAYALRIARHMVMPPRRDGGQRQYAEPAAPTPGSTFAGLLDWATERLHEPLTLADLASYLGVSERTLGRRFRDELGVSPGQWLLSQRLERARVLLESGDDTIEAVARRSGLSSASNLRRRFASHVATSPGSYRRTFRAPSARGA